MISLDALKAAWRRRGAQAAVVLGAAAIAGSMLLPEAPQSPAAQSAPTTACADETERRLGEVLSAITGAGRTEVVIQYAREAYADGGWFSEGTGGRGEPVAAIVVAEGAGDVAVRLRLALAVETLLQLDAESVEVFEMCREE